MSGPSLLTRIVNAVVYQLAWFACVFGASWQQPYLALGAGAMTIAWHLRGAARPRREVALLAVALIVGAVVESWLRLGGFVRSQHAWPWADPAWVCMLVLWCSFATTLNVSMRSLRPHLIGCALIGGLGAPLAYAAGARLGALQWTDARMGLLFIGVAWAIALPFLMAMSRRLDGFADLRQERSTIAM